MVTSLLLKVEKVVIAYYLQSGDFNGISLANLIHATDSDFEKIQQCVIDGIDEDKLRVISSDHEMNPHIIRQDFSDKKVQIECLRLNNIDHTCIYPSKKLLRENVSSSVHEHSPFTRMLALGFGQLEITFFELDLLDFYQSDPRYYYECNDIGGRICIKDEYYINDDIGEKDKVLLKAFGIAYDSDLNRFIAGFISDIADLSPEHQKIWHSKQVYKSLKVHPDFYGAQILGRWPSHISIFDAVLHEQRIINSMVNKMGKPSLFIKDFGKYLENKPKDFSFLLRPTSREYDGFLILLDKIMSDNINKHFFKGDIGLTNEIKLKNGRTQVEQKGTIVLLDQWLRKHYKTNNWEPWDFAINIFKDIRKQRQSPAHEVNENTYDPLLVKKQRQLMKGCWEALAVLRHALSNHPKCVGQDFDIPEAIIQHKIWTF